MTAQSTKGSEPTAPVITPGTDTNTKILTWRDALLVDKNQLGGKGWHLAQLEYYGFNVAVGGVIPVVFYQQFIDHNNLQNDIRHLSRSISMENVLDTEIRQQLSRLHHKFSNGTFTRQFQQQLSSFLCSQGLDQQAVAVRSSATAEDSDKASFAGIHQSFLNVQGINAILEKIKACYASLWTPHALAYRRKMEFDDQQVLAAVVIMQMVNADAAGVAFSCDPVSGREDGYLISANFGLGESVVNGAVEPDSYFVEQHGFTTIDEYLGKKSLKTVCVAGGGTVEINQAVEKQTVLTPNQRTRLAWLIQRIHDALGKSEIHQDIEWVLDNDEFHIVQARPVTVLPTYALPKLRDKKTIWSNANYRDVIPMVQTLMQRHTLAHTINTTILTPFRMVGYELPPGLSVNKLVNGRAYFNLGLYQWLLYDTFGSLPDDVNLLAGGHQPNINIPNGSPFHGRTGLRRILHLLKHVRLMGKYTKQRQMHYDRCNEFCARIETSELGKLTNHELLAWTTGIRQLYTDFGPVYMFLNSNLGPLLMAIKQINKYFPGRGTHLVNSLVAGRGNITSADHGYRLLQLIAIAKNDDSATEFLHQNNFIDHNWKSLSDKSPFKQAFSDFLTDYGHRGVFELNITMPRWREDPSYLLEHIASCMDSDINLNKGKQHLIYKQAVTTLSKKLGFVRRKIIMNLVDKGIKGSEIREWAKSILVRICSSERILLREHGHRLQRMGLIDCIDDIFHCSPAELLSIFNGVWNGQSLKQLIQERKQKIAELERLSAPDVIIDEQEIYAIASADADNKGLKGIAVSAGEAQGFACKLTSPTQSRLLNKNGVLVAPATDPSWTPLFLKAGAIVLETGGYTSHGSIVAREYGIPAVVNVAGAMTWINNGESVIVSGDTGIVYKKETTSL